MIDKITLIRTVYNNIEICYFLILYIGILQAASIGQYWCPNLVPKLAQVLLLDIINKENIK